jgi:phosphoribosyl 1,2-cyclic phosphodiesterase
MKVRFWGTRGSLASPGPDTARYGGNTACVEVRGEDGAVLVLDAGTGIRRLGAGGLGTPRRVDLLLTHLHMDHVQGLGFFAPLYMPGLEVHIWGPASTTLSLRARLGRYMSPPLFPVRLRDLPCRLTVHEVPCGTVRIGPFTVDSALVCHPGPTTGFRIATADGTLSYLPDHEPALGVAGRLAGGGWTSGLSLAAGADLLIHDAQYDDREYSTREGWGHSTVRRAIEFAALAGARRLVLFHHDPAHDDATLESLVAEAVARERPSFPVAAAMEGTSVDVAR